MKSENATILNLTCKFGSKDLLDLANEIIIPAFKSNLERKYGATRYLLIDVQIADIGEEGRSEKAIYGRFIKDTILKSEQILTSDKQLIEQNLAIQSSPSAFFVLLLKDHRLIYLAETAYAPDYKTFASTLQWIFRKKRRSHINELFKKAPQNLKSEEKLALKKQIENEFVPNVTVNLFPIPTNESMTKFIDRYSTLKSIKFKINRSNAEINPATAWQAIEENFPSGLEGSTTIETRNPEGLDKGHAKRLITDGNKVGVHEVLTDGLDNDGFKLKGKNEDMGVEKTLENIPPTLKGKANKLVHLFKGSPFRKASTENSVQEKLHRIIIDDE